MKLSIIVPIYNGEKYLEKCMKSIFKGIDDTAKIEVILINDGSTDRTIEVLEKFKESDKVKIFNNKNKGVSYSRNYGIDIASGQWIMFVDCDDILMDNWWEKVINAIENNYSSDIIYFGKGYTNKFKDDKKRIIRNILGLENDIQHLYSPCSRVYKKELLINNLIKFQNGIINGEDMLFNIEALGGDSKVLFVDDSIYKYRTNIKSSTNSFNENIYKSDSLFQQVLKDILKKHGFNNKEIKEINMFCYVNSIFVIAKRISLVKDKNQRNNEYEKLQKRINKDTLNYKIALSKKIIIYFIKFKIYSLITILFYIKRKILNNKEKFVEI